jgi:hypothetical protein
MLTNKEADRNGKAARASNGEAAITLEFFYFWFQLQI